MKEKNRKRKEGEKENKIQYYDEKKRRWRSATSRTPYNFRLIVVRKGTGEECDLKSCGVKSPDELEIVEKQKAVKRRKVEIGNKTKNSLLDQDNEGRNAQEDSRLFCQFVAVRKDNPAKLAPFFGEKRYAGKESSGVLIRYNPENYMIISLLDYKEKYKGDFSIYGVENILQQSGITCEEESGYSSGEYDEASEENGVVSGGDEGETEAVKRVMQLFNDAYNGNNIQNLESQLKQYSQQIQLKELKVIVKKIDKTFVFNKLRHVTPKNVESIFKSVRRLFNSISIFFNSVNFDFPVHSNGFLKKLFFEKYKAREVKVVLSLFKILTNQSNDGGRYREKIKFLQGALENLIESSSAYFKFSRSVEYKNNYNEFSCAGNLLDPDEEIQEIITSYKNFADFLLEVAENRNVSIQLTKVAILCYDLHLYFIENTESASYFVGSTLHAVKLAIDKRENSEFFEEYCEKGAKMAEQLSQNGEFPINELKIYYWLTLIYRAQSNLDQEEKYKDKFIGIYNNSLKEIRSLFKSQYREIEKKPSLLSMSPNSENLFKAIIIGLFNKARKEENAELAAQEFQQGLHGLSNNNFKKLVEFFSLIDKMVAVLLNQVRFVKNYQEIKKEYASTLRLFDLIEIFCKFVSQILKSNKKNKEGFWGGKKEIDDLCFRVEIFSKNYQLNKARAYKCLIYNFITCSGPCSDYSEGKLTKSVITKALEQKFPLAEILETAIQDAYKCVMFFLHLLFECVSKKVYKPESLFDMLENSLETSEGLADWGLDYADIFDESFDLSPIIHVYYLGFKYKCEKNFERSIDLTISALHALKNALYRGKQEEQQGPQDPQEQQQIYQDCYKNGVKVASKLEKETNNSISAIKLLEIYYWLALISVKLGNIEKSDEYINNFNKLYLKSNEYVNVFEKEFNELLGLSTKNQSTALANT